MAAAPRALSLLRGALFAALLSATPVAAQEDGEIDRVALVVGIGDYDRLVDLPNPRQDARAIAANLWTAGFEVIEAIDADARSLRAAIRLLIERLEPGSEAAIFFAGHGVQIGSENFLLARDAGSPSDEASGLVYGAVASSELIDAISQTGVGISIFILDACRTSPFDLREDSSRGAAAADIPPGLAPILAPIRTETLIAYSTAPGLAAADGPEDGHSPFADALIRHMQTPGLEIGQLFRHVRADVRQATNDKQIPWVNLSLEHRFYFRQPDLAEGRVSGVTDDAIGLLPPADVHEVALWQTALSGGEREDFEIYLQRYPEGRYAQEAQRRRSTETGNAPSATGAPELLYLAAGTEGDLDLPIPSDAESDGVDATILGLPDGLDVRTAAGRSVEVGDRLDLDALKGLSYATDRTTLGRLGAIAVEFRSDDDASVATTDVTTIIHACDMLAGWRTDPHRVGRGARFELIEADLALAICRRALDRHPESPRFQSIYARVLRKLERFDEAREWNAPAREAGYEAAYSQQGQMHRLGQGGPVDMVAAAENYARAAELGGAGGMAALGDLYLRGEGVERDEQRGLRLILAAATQGYDWAHALMGRNHEVGYGVAQSYEDALSWYSEAAEMGDIYSKLKLGHFYENGLGVPFDAERAFAWFEAAAGHGVPYAQVRFGRIHAEGRITRRDLETAVYWYEKAAAQGDVEGIYWLADALLEGSGVEADPERAVALLTAAAEKDHPRSMHRLADLRAEGEVVERSDSDAQRLYARALELGETAAARPLARLLLENGEPRRAEATLVAAVGMGDAWAMRDLARLLREGRDLPQDLGRAAALTLQAAESGNAYALRDRARDLERGRGVAADPAAAFEAMARAAADVPWARIDLARYYEDGVGVAPDPGQSALWLARAAVSDDASAVETAREQLGEAAGDACLAGLGLELESRRLIPAGPRDSLAARAVAGLTRLGRAPTPGTDFCAELMTFAQAG